MIDLSIYPKFLRDTEGHTQTLEILVVIGWESGTNGDYHSYFGKPKHDAIFLAQEEKSWLYWHPEDSEWADQINAFGANISIFWYDFGMELPYFEEKVDILERKSSVNDLTLTINNFDKKDISGGLNHWGRDLTTTDELGLPVEYGQGRLKGNFKFSDILNIKPIINEQVAIFLKSPSASGWDDLVPVYLGVITDTKQKMQNVQIILEDISDFRFKNEMPKTLMLDNDTVPEKQRGKPIPMQFGLIDNAPTTYARITGYTGEETAHQEIFYLDTEELFGTINNDLLLADGQTKINQSFFSVYEDGYWNLSAESADENGDAIEDGMPNFQTTPLNNQILMIGSAFGSFEIEDPNNPGQLILLSEMDYPSNDDALNGLYELYQADDGDDSGSGPDGSDSGEDDGTEGGDPVNLFNLKNDTVNGKLRIHAFTKPEDVQVLVRKNKANDKMILNVKSYSSENAHTTNNPDDILDMSKCYNWSGSSLVPDVTSFVEITGTITARYRYKSRQNCYHYPTFSVDFGNNGVPFKDYEELTDTAYYMKSTFQCTHPAAFGIYAGSQGVFLDQGTGWVDKLNPGINRSIDMLGNTPQEIPAPGNQANLPVQYWHWNIDTIHGDSSTVVDDVTVYNSSIIENYGLALNKTDLFENTSQLAQADGEILIGAVHQCVRRGGNWPFYLNGYGGEYFTYQYGVGGQYTGISISNGLALPFTMRLYNIAAFSTYLVTRDPKFDYFANIKGRIGSTDERYSGDSYLRKPSDIICNILRTEYGLSSSIDYLGTDLNKARTEHSNWHLDFAITEQNEGKRVIQDIASSSKLVPSFSSVGKFKLNSIQNKYSWEDTVEIPSGDVVKFDFLRTQLREIYTKVVLKYHKDYGTGKYLKTIEKDVYELLYPMVAGFENSDGQAVQSHYSPTFYGTNEMDEKTLTVESDFIRSDDVKNLYMVDTDINSFDVTAHKLVNFLLAFHCNQHTILKITLPIKYFYLETGDILRLTDILGDGKAFAFGEDYTKIQVRNGQFIYPAFYITKVKRRLDKGIDIEAMQMHYLNEDSSAEHGWQPPDEPEYAIYGCLDDGYLPDEESAYPGEAAINYNPNTTYEMPCIYRGDLDSSLRIDWVDAALLQIAITDDNIILEAPGTPLFNQMDIDQDGVVSLLDIYAIMERILTDVNLENYGCMDGGGSGAGASWGPDNYPAALNYDPDAIIHDQSMCLYAMYVCGGTHQPDYPSINWCSSTIDTVDNNNCMEVNDSGNITGDAFSNFTDLMIEIGEQQDEDYPQLLSFEINQHLTGVGTGLNTVNECISPFGGYYAGGGGATVNIFYGVKQDEYIRPYAESNFTNGVFDVNCVCVAFAQITLKAGHKYALVNMYEEDLNEDGWNYQDNIGAGVDYYIGSWQQHPVGANQGLTGSGLNVMNADVTPIFQVVKMKGRRYGKPSVWLNLDGADEGIFDQAYSDPLIFTAPSDATIIPGHPDIPGPLWGDAYGGYSHDSEFSNVNWLGYGANVYTSPFPSHTVGQFLNLQNASSMGYEDDTVYVSKSWQDWHGGPDTLEYGTEYQTNICKAFYSPHATGDYIFDAVNSEPLFTGEHIKLLDLTAGFQESGDDADEPGSVEEQFFDTVNENVVNANCIDSYKGPQGFGDE